jgi:formylglycine-generating enzyme required for sulfatase activity
MRKFILFFSFVIFIFCLLSSVFCPFAYANNISVTNVATGTQDTVANTLEIQFNLSWENSWRDSINYDAAWIFVKYSTDSGSTWHHAYLSTTAADHTIPAGYECKVGVTDVSGNKGTGVFIQRSSTGSGTASLSGVKLIWNYADNSNDVVTDDEATHPITTQIRVLAIEMVYIPEGNFYAGDNAGGSGGSTDTILDKDNNYPALISTDANIIYSTDTNYDDAQFGNSGAGILVDGDGGIDKDGTTAVDNANFPTGYNKFYIMKYEVSQGQYTDFLNMLTRTQQNTRTYSNVSINAITNIYVMSNTAAISYRNTIVCPASGNGTTAPIVFSTTTPNRACNWLCWMDLAAYAAWAGLRPFTELEFEKACRGPSNAQAGEYAWGNANRYNAYYTITNDGTANATVNQGTGIGNLSCNETDGSINGPLRCGIFAQSGTSRQEAGASYYGVMELSGNLWERPVTVGNLTGRNFDGAHGNGELSTNGNANETSLQYWPGYSAGEISGATGSGFRGGNWSDDATYARVSDRYNAANTYTDRHYTFGARCARTSP